MKSYHTSSSVLPNLKISVLERKWIKVHVLSNCLAKHIQSKSTGTPGTTMAATEDMDVPVSGSLEVGKGVERKTEARPTDGEDSTSSCVASYTTHSAPYLILTAVLDCICNSCVMRDKI